MCIAEKCVHKEALRSQSTGDGFIAKITELTTKVKNSGTQSYSMVGQTEDIELGRNQDTLVIEKLALDDDASESGDEEDDSDRIESRNSDNEVVVVGTGARTGTKRDGFTNAHKLKALDTTEEDSNDGSGSEIEDRCFFDGSESSDAGDDDQEIFELGSDVDD